MPKIDHKNLAIFISGAISSLVLAWLYGADFRFPDERKSTQETLDQQAESVTSQEGLSEQAKIRQVIDGDTVILESGEKVRLLGIDTPEIGEDFYEEASVRLRELVDNKEVRLQKDISQTDRYGRLLRHIYIDDMWVNETMISEGYARFITYPPDVSHVERFKELQREALENKRGMWQNK